jgi:hypothetical protein
VRIELQKLCCSSVAALLQEAEAEFALLRSKILGYLHPLQVLI